jgi:hypothetical protein
MQSRTTSRGMLAGHSGAPRALFLPGTRAIHASVLGIMGYHHKHLRCYCNITFTIRGWTKFDSRGSPKYVTCVEMWGGTVFLPPSNIDLGRLGEAAFCQSRCSISWSPYKTGAGTCCSPTFTVVPSHGHSLPSRVIAEQILLRCRTSTGRPASVQLSWCFSRSVVGSSVPALTQASRPGM